METISLRTRPPSRVPTCWRDQRPGPEPGQTPAETLVQHPGTRTGSSAKNREAAPMGPESTAIKYTIAPNGYGPPHGGDVEAVQSNDGPGLALGPASRPGTGTFPAQTTPGHPKYPEKHPCPSSGNLGRFSGTRTQMMPPVLPARPVARGNANTAEGYRAAPCWLTTIPTRTTPTSPLKGWTPTTCRPSRTHSYSGYIPNPADAE